LALVKFVKTGVPPATSSLRNSWEIGVPVLPSCTYIRVLPLGSAATSKAGRVWNSAGFSDGLICAQVAPASVDRQMPRA
jgi:hypothetical protein